MCPVNSQNEEKLAQYSVSPAHGRDGSQDEVKLAPPYARSLAHARGGSQDEEKNLLLPLFTPRPYIYLGYRDYIILFGIYMSLVDFNMNYQYILQTLMYIDVFQSVDSLILLRMQHSPSPLDPHPRGGRATIHSVPYSQNDIYCTTIIARLPEEGRANCKVNILEMPSARLQENEQQVPRHL